jgi:multisubunit Na+/H+ antiporter MnhB subunit
MTYNTGAAAHSRFSPTSSDAENVDRILLATCAAIWLAVLGSAVAAAVALVDLGSKHQESSSESGTPWLLYGVIGVSALIIVGAIPLLIRARRSALVDPRAGHGGGDRPAAGRPQTPPRGSDPRTQNLRTAQQTAGGARQRSAPQPTSRISTFDAALPPAVDRVWLRCAVVMASAMGVALLAVGIATYLMAAGHDTFAWAVYVVAGLVTLAMPAIPWIYLRQLHEVVDTH